MTEPPTLRDHPAEPKPLIPELLVQLRGEQRRGELLQAKVDELARRPGGRMLEAVDPNRQPPIDPTEQGLESKTGPTAEGEPEVERLYPCCEVPMPWIRGRIHEQLRPEPAPFEVLEHGAGVRSRERGCHETTVSSSKPAPSGGKRLALPGSAGTRDRQLESLSWLFEVPPGLPEPRLGEVTPLERVAEDGLDSHELTA